MAQNWNNVLNYIKRNLGSKLNLLELSDEEIIEGLNEDTLQYFSQYSPLKRAIYIDSENKLSDSPINSPNTYLLPISEDDYMIGILEAYSSPGDSHADPLYGTKYSQASIAGTVAYYGYGQIGRAGGAVIDAVISNSFIDMMDSMSVQQTWEFFPPDKIVFDIEINDAVILANFVHKKLETIAPDMYNMYFKPLALAHTQKWIASLRNKYETLTTPSGEVNVNYQKLEEDANRTIEKIEEALNRMPLEHYLELS